MGPFFGGIISDLLGFDILFKVLAGVTLFGVLIIVTQLSTKTKLYGKPAKKAMDRSILQDLIFAYLCLFPYTLSSGVYFSILPGYMREIGLTATVIGGILTLSNIMKGAGFLGFERLVN